MKDMGQSARETLAPQINEPHQPAVSNSEQGEHTPGPWRVELSPIRRTICVVSGDTWICGEIENPIAPIGGQASANARLIAAAPDMLAALYKIAQGGNSVNVDWPASPAIDKETMCDIARAAIAKARGQS